MGYRSADVRRFAGVPARTTISAIRLSGYFTHKHLKAGSEQGGSPTCDHSEHRDDFDKHPIAHRCPGADSKQGGYLTCNHSEHRDDFGKHPA